MPPSPRQRQGVFCVDISPGLPALTIGDYLEQCLTKGQIYHGNVREGDEVVLMLARDPWIEIAES